MSVDRRPSRARLRVLVVDDDPLIRQLLHAVLQSGDYLVEEASDGTQALRLAREHTPDIVVLDIMMPGVSGYDVCREMRADPDMRRSRIVMLTARNSEIDRREGMLAGADAFFTKPFSPLDLIESIAGPTPTTTGSRQRVRAR